jgi:large subunit ribosomal protein L10
MGMATEGKRWDLKRQPDEDIPTYKKNELAAIRDLAKDNKVLGIVNITGIPGEQFQQMRKNLSASVKMKVVRNNLLYLAMKEVFGDNKSVDEFLDNVEGQTALVATDINPFKLYKQMEATKTKSPARGGEKAPEDVIVNEGETDFKAGPIVGDLQKVGIPAGIVSGKVVIKNTKTVVKAGGRISQPLAVMLTRLDILPLTVGLDLRAALEEAMVFRKDVLAVDEVLIRTQVVRAASGAYNLAMFMSYPTALTTKPLIAKAHNQALGLALAASIVNKESVGPLLAKAQAHAATLKAILEGGSVAGPKDPITGEAVSEKEPEDKPKDDDKTSEQKEEQAAAGLGSLFGD